MKSYRFYQSANRPRQRPTNTVHNSDTRFAHRTSQQTAGCSSCRRWQSIRIHQLTRYPFLTMEYLLSILSDNLLAIGLQALAYSCNFIPNQTVSPNGSITIGDFKLMLHCHRCVLV